MYLNCTAPSTAKIAFEELPDETVEFCDTHLDNALKAQQLGFVVIVTVERLPSSLTTP